MLNGRIGQVLGPFGSNDLLLKDGAIGILTPETVRPKLLKLGIQTTPGTMVLINDRQIKVGRTGIYEIDNVAYVTSLSFPNGADDTTIVDFIY